VKLKNLSFVGITAELTDEKLASLFDSENPRGSLFSTVGVLSESFKRNTTRGIALNPVLKHDIIGRTILISNVNCSRQPYRA
jgi:hypothetical protein